MRVTAKLAKSLAARADVQDGESLSDLRDWVDQKTGGELDTLQLDLLTELVELESKKRHTLGRFR